MTELRMSLERTIKLLRERAAGESQGLERLRLTSLADVLTAEMRVQAQRVSAC